MSSRLALDSKGRRIVVQTSESVGIPFGWRGLLVGDTVQAGGTAVFFQANRSGRPPTARERSTVRAPYDPTTRTRREQAQTVDDDELAEPDAIELARLEQQFAPTDLVSAVAA
jgi:hypothetical protein